MFALTRQVKLAHIFGAYVLARNIRYEQDLVDQRCNSSEKRLAHILLRMAHFDRHGARETTIAKISHKMPAEMTGTTRSRVCFYMKRFKNSGFILRHATPRFPREFGHPLNLEPFFRHGTYAKTLAASSASARNEQDALVSGFRIPCFGTFVLWACHLAESRKSTLGSFGRFGCFRGICGHEAQHLLFHLRIHLVRYRQNSG